MGRPGQDGVLQGARAVRPGLVLHPRRCAAAAAPPLRRCAAPRAARRRLTLSPPFPPPAAAIARRVYLRGGVGVGAFKKIFGGRQMRGTIREKFSTGSGSIARHILKQLEALKIVEKVPNGKGRRITPQGQRDLDSIAGQVGRPPSPPRPLPRRPPAPPAPGSHRRW